MLIEINAELNYVSYFMNKKWDIGLENELQFKEPLQKP